MTVAELRRALEGVADDVQVHISYESWTRIPDEAGMHPIWIADEEDIGDGIPENWRDYPHPPVSCFYIR